jgi:hypothetical protein
MTLVLPAQRQYGNFRGQPRWLADFTSAGVNLVRTPALLDPTVFNDYASVVVTTTAIAAIGATSVAISALAQGPTPVDNVVLSAGNVVIPSGTSLSFGGGKFARLTADAILGATTLTVAALPTALASGDVARYNPLGGNTKYLPSGLLVGRTITERDAGTPFGVADVVTPDDEIFLTRFDLADANRDSGVELVKHGATIKENYLPDWASYTTAMKTWLRANYNCIVGVD